MRQAQHVLQSTLAALHGPQIVILALALGLALAWFGPAALALGLPFALMLIPRRTDGGSGERRRSTPPAQMAEMAAALDDRLRAVRRTRHQVLCVTLTIGGFEGLPHGLGERLVTTCLDHLSHGLRREDALFELGCGRFGVIPAGAHGMDAQAAHRLTARLEAHAAEGLSDIRGAEGLAVASGFCLETQPGMRSGRTLIADSLATAGTG